MTWFDIELLQDLHSDLFRFSRQVKLLADRCGIKLNEYGIDHIALRCHQVSTANRWYQGFEKAGHCFNETEINGRPIALFTLGERIDCGEFSVDCVELPWPGKRLYPHEGWEHIEIVLPVEPLQLHHRAIALLSDEALRAPDIKIKQSAPKAMGETLSNPTLAVTDGKVTIKFHPYPLTLIVASEKG